MHAALRDGHGRRGPGGRCGQSRRGQRRQASGQGQVAHGRSCRAGPLGQRPALPDLPGRRDGRRPFFSLTTGDAPMTPRNQFSGPTLFSYGFRPFFLGAALFGLCVVPVWFFIWRGDLALQSHFAPVDWHVHEMLFGYAAAVIAGFLFTAVPNWTGRMPARGWPLAALVTLWLAGRLAVAGVGGLPPGAVMLIDCGFLAAI